MNKRLYIQTLALGLFVWSVRLDAALAQTPPPPPLSAVSNQTFKRQAQPDMKQPVTSRQPLTRAVPLSATAPSPWQRLTRQPTFFAGAMLLLTDGTVMVHDQGSKNNGSSNWWRLTPDVNGSYLNGKWSKLASLPSGYAPLYFASAILPDGRVIIEGGNYNNGQQVFTNLGAIYDPLANKWAPVSPPDRKGWEKIGAAASTVLANGTFMIGGISTIEQVLFNPTDLSWTVTGKGKADINAKENWTLLPNGRVLTVDTNNLQYLTNSELYLPELIRKSCSKCTSGRWICGGSTIVLLPDTNKDGSGTHEMGPQLLRPDGTVFAAGATGHTAVYDSLEGTWKPAPDFPNPNGTSTGQYSAGDSPAALLPSGNVLVMASPGVGNQPPAHFFVFDGTNLKQIIPDPRNAVNLSAYYGYMIVLPTGQVMFNSRFGDIELYTDSGAIADGTAPTITTVPTTLVTGMSYPLTGKQLNGVSQAAAYGEGYQSATNYPLVRIVIAKTKHVFYARTFGHSSMGVTPGAVSSTNFTVPAGIETGAATLFAVANGIASNPISVTVAKK
ncbi:hypothetical protein QEV83_10405 [Methylocapsa sp. D3K7]|uniref:hypothetical protein n=1 Tax=Methylocapsa sp. D3K7 TaxID=3041435 RepID=UPI00244EFF6B|nr:hypothetical protein [Methylocapsa sp. D3K7]WGJ13137.1 hypothetical protein QEV83_10405 [Methylocapsa sp. D3K7]